MKVEFDIEEIWTMFNSVLDELITAPGLKAERKASTASLGRPPASIASAER